MPISLSVTDELFLVIRSVEGGATGNNLFNLNHVEFNGPGASVVKTDTSGGVSGNVPADAVAVTRHAGHLRGVHPRCRAGLQRPDDGQRDLERG